MVAEELKLIVKAEVDEAVRKLRDFQGETDNTSKSGMNLAQAFTNFTVGINQSLEILNKVGQALGEVMAAAERAATINQLTVAFRNMAEKAGVSADELLESMREASQGTVSTVDLMKAASRANLFGLPMEKLGALMKIARASSQATGESMTFMFDSIVTGIGRSSPLILDNLGIMINLQEANDKYAATLGKKASQLTEAERAQALFNQVLEKGEAIINKVGASTATDAEQFAKFRVSVDEAKQEIGRNMIPSMRALSGAGGQLADDFVKAEKTADFVEQGLKGVEEQAKKAGEELNLLDKIILRLGGGLIKRAGALPKPELKSLGPQTFLFIRTAEIKEIAAGAADYARYLAEAQVVSSAFLDTWDEGANIIATAETAIDSFKKKQEELGESLKETMSALAEGAFLETFQAAGQAMVDAGAGAQSFRDVMKNALSGVLEAISKWQLALALAALANPLTAWMAPGHFAASAAAAVAAGVVKALAEGGIVTKPTMAMIGERGPEAVIPLNKASGLGQTIVFNVAGSIVRERDLYRRADRWRQNAYAGY